ncbi:MAG: viroplasmin family protein [Bacillota bacterium]
MSKKKYYAVKKGRKNGIYNSWEECKKQVYKYKNAEYKSFKSLDKAKNFMNDSNIEDIYGEKLNKQLKEKKAVLAYVDGSFSKKKKIYSYGCVLLDTKEVANLKGIGKDKSIISMRNVAGELLAAKKAIKWAIENNYEKIVIHYDYSGIKNWAKGFWKTNKKGTIEYKKFIDKIKDKIKIEFIKVKAHSGDKYNDKADKLAKDAIDNFTK